LLRVVGIVGYRKSGKTAVIEGLIKELVKRGYRVGTIKHVPIRGFTIDQPQKDTWRHARAGASVVVSIAPGETAQISKRRAKLMDALRALHDLDFVLVEGFREAKNIAKVAVARSKSEAAKIVDEFTIACIGHGKGKLPILQPEESEKLARLVEREALPPLPALDCGYCGYSSCRKFALAALSGRARWDGCRAMLERVELTVDGKRVYLNPFMQDLIAGIIDGMLSKLKDAKGKRVELKVRRHA
jgi:molybdopterin-guanine dinucleotide biosynthesis protein B